MRNQWTILDPAALDAHWSALNPASGLVVPDYFVRTTFLKMGGLVAVGSTGAIALLFPRALVASRRVYTLRLLGGGDSAALADLVAPDTLAPYDPADAPSLTYRPTHAAAGPFDLGAPARAELSAIAALQRAIWGGGPETHYPADLHSAELGPATSLVARHDGRLAGFLLGFYRFALPALAGLGLPYRLDLAVESQVMGVDPAARRHGLAATLKRAQARRALAEGLDLIHWTADPLQYPNAVLNFARLRAVAGEHYPAYYPFQNELNRVPASRLGLVWLPRSARGAAGLAETPHQAARGLGRFSGIARLNRGATALEDPDRPPFLALAIPADWTALQRDDLPRAARWRAVTDALLARHLGFAPGRYLAVDAASEGDERFLVLQRFDPGLLLP